MARRRLGVMGVVGAALAPIDDAKVAEVHTRTSEEVREEVGAGAPMATLRGEVSAESTTSYDLHDGAIRRSITASIGDLAVRIAPPAGVEADPADGTISYDVRVRVTRLT